MFKRLINCLVLGLFATACTGVDVHSGTLRTDREAAMDFAMSATDNMIERTRGPAARPMDTSAVMTSVGVLALAGGIAWLVAEGGDVDGSEPERRYVHKSNVD